MDRRPAVDPPVVPQPLGGEKGTPGSARSSTPRMRRVASLPDSDGPPPHAQPFTVALTGDVDIARTGELAELVASFRRSSATDVVVDLVCVEFMDSTGLMAMARLRAIAQQRGGTVRLVGPCRPVRRILDVSGFGALCEIVDG